MMALAIVVLGFSSCTKDPVPVDPNEPAVVTTASAEKVVGAYRGYTLAACAYFSDMFTADENVVISLVNDSTVKVEFASAVWGEFVIGEALVKGTQAPYTVSGNGTCKMTGMGGNINEYDCSFSASLDMDGADEMSFSVPAVMGGTTVTFKEGTAPLGYYVAGKYDGTLNYGVGEMGDEPVEASVTLKRNGDDKIDIVLPAVGEGMMTIPEIALTDIAISTTDYKVFAIAETEINQTVGTINYVGSITGEVNNGTLKLNYSLQPGAMPMSINFTFEGE